MTELPVRLRLCSTRWLLGRHRLEGLLNRNIRNGNRRDGLTTFRLLFRNRVISFLPNNRWLGPRVWTINHIFVTHPNSSSL
ncbi:hypothetical protein [Bifidobacterium moukalabense]|uniref:hypothetical protein n=1 Tax=Bifidobacterium moukalabense TaxID=1333651 RepID=UPI0010FA368D|nr:hypothetical protein [Bifidobacterium moukalabense]